MKKADSDFEGRNSCHNNKIKSPKLSLVGDKLTMIIISHRVSKYVDYFEIRRNKIQTNNKTF